MWCRLTQMASASPYAGGSEQTTGVRVNTKRGYNSSSEKYRGGPRSLTPVVNNKEVRSPLPVDTPGYLSILSPYSIHCSTRDRGYLTPYKEFD